MTHGLRVKNSAGELQIDSIYCNLAFGEGGTVAIAENYNWGYMTPTLISITSSPLIPLILVRPPTDRFITVYDYKQSGSNFTGFQMLPEFMSGGCNVDWRCYRETPSNPTGYGFRVKDASGKMIFSSSLNYFKIFSVHSISLAQPDPNVGYGYEDITHSGISNPYYILSRNGWMLCTIGEPPYIEIREAKIGIKKLSSTSVRVGWFDFLQGDFGSSEYAYWNPAVKLIVCQI